MVHCSYFKSHNMLRYEKREGCSITVIPKGKAKSIILGYNLAKDSLIIVIPTTFNLVQNINIYTTDS